MVREETAVTVARSRKYIAVDLGAASGRVMLGSLSDELLELEEIHRFANGPVEQDNSLRWPFENILREVKTGLGKAIHQAGGDVAGIAVDSWGVDFGLLGEDGRLLERPYHYRDGRTNGMMEKAFELMPKRQIYDCTGIQFMQINTVYQLLAMRLADSKVLNEARKLLFIADLVAYHLCGESFAEYSLASTSQLMNMRTGCWAKEVFEGLSLPIEIMPEIVSPGTVVGKLTKGVARELGCKRIPVIAAASHDTAAAVAAIPATGGNWAYNSCGTWSLIGLEVPHPVINDKTFGLEFTNEGGVNDTIRLLKNMMGLWMIQECKKQWENEGTELSYSQLTEMAAEAEPFAGCIADVEYGEFHRPGDMVRKINDYLRGSGQKPVDDKGQLVRVILESLALRSRQIFEWLEEITGSTVDVVHMVGGGIKNRLLCQFTADASGKTVVAGPVEATAAGNVITQAIATGQLSSLQQARQIIEKSFKLTTYRPKETQVWDGRFGACRGGGGLGGD